MLNGFSVIKQNADLKYRDTFYIKLANTDSYINHKKMQLIKYFS